MHANVPHNMHMYGCMYITGRKNTERQKQKDASFDMAEY